METVYHVREHSETGQPPLARWEAGGPFPLPAQADLAEAFRWSEWRTVSRTALVSLHGNQYQVDPALARRRVELVFDPFDLTVLFVRRDGKDAGTATPHHITRHSHPKASRPSAVKGHRPAAMTTNGSAGATSVQAAGSENNSPASSRQ